MDIKRLDNIKYWILAFLLAFSTFCAYARYRYLVKDEIFIRAMPVSYILFFFVIILFVKKVEFNFKEKWHSVFIFGILILNIFYLIYFKEPIYGTMVAETISILQVFLITLIGVSIINTNIISSILNRYYFMAFLVGLTVLSVKFSKNHFLDENTWGFYIAPFLIYLFVKCKKLSIRILIYCVACFLLYQSGAGTTFLAFFTLPLFMILFNYIKRPRVIYTLLLISGIVTTFLAAVFKSDLVTKVLSNRNGIWALHLDVINATKKSFFTGTGTWYVDMSNALPQFIGLEAHSTFISILTFNGFLVLILYLCFIIFGVRKRSNSFTISDGILYLSVTFQFFETNHSIFSYTFMTIIFLMNILINKESEDVDRYNDMLERN